MKLATRLGMKDEDYIIMLEAGFALLAAGRIEEALDIFNGYIEINPSSELPYIGISRCYSAEGKLMRAEDWARRAFKQKRNSPLAKLTLAEILIMQGKEEDARKILEKISEDDCCDPSLHKWEIALTEIIKKRRQRNAIVQEETKVYSNIPGAFVRCGDS